MLDNKHLTKRIVEIEWVDSMGTHGWSEDVSRGVSVCQSVGYVVNETDDHITLSESICITKPSSSYGCQTSIPKCAITKTRTIRNRK